VLGLNSCDSVYLGWSKGGLSPPSALFPFWPSSSWPTLPYHLHPVSHGFRHIFQSFCLLADLSVSRDVSNWYGTQDLRLKIQNHLTSSAEPQRRDCCFRRMFSPGQATFQGPFDGGAEPWQEIPAWGLPPEARAGYTLCFLT
jgi:hypothetical protein